MTHSLEDIKVTIVGPALADSETVSHRLETIRNSDFIHLDISGEEIDVHSAYELGYASALGIPIVTKHKLTHTVLSKLIPDIQQEAFDLNNIQPGSGLDYLQNYYKRTAQRRGWGEETARDTMLLLTEEIGELARAVRKHVGLSRTDEYDVNMADELADVQLYLVHMANNVGINLAQAVTEKDRKNGAKLAAKTKDQV